jgi:hypothetical protein
LCLTGHPQDCIQLSDQGLQIALRKWWQLPELGVAPHLAMLHSFQVLVEVQESARLLADLHNTTRTINQAQQGQVRLPLICLVLSSPIPPLILPSSSLHPPLILP